MVAWSFIILAGLSVAFGLIQFVVVHAFVDQDALTAGITAPGRGGNLPASVLWLFAHIEALTTWFLMLSGVTLAASIGLLKRRNWARWTFVVLMLLAIVFHLWGLYVQHDLMQWMPAAMGMPGSSMSGGVHATMTVLWVVSVAFALGFSAVFAWIAYKLITPAIAAEFR